MKSHISSAFGNANLVFKVRVRKLLHSAVENDVCTERVVLHGFVFSFADHLESCFIIL